MKPAWAIAALFGFLSLAACYGAGATATDSPFALIEAEVTSGTDTDSAIGVSNPETGEQVGEIRWEALEYHITLRNESGHTLENVEVRLLPSQEIKDLYGLDPFAQSSGGRSNYGNLPFAIEPGQELDIRRSIITFAHETQYARDVESPLTPAQAERLMEIAHQVTLEVKWNGSAQRFGLEALILTPISRTEVPHPPCGLWSGLWTFKNLCTIIAS